MEFNNTLKESEEQEALFQWASIKRNTYPELDLLFHVPNGGSRNKKEAYNLKKQGVKSGVPDLFLPVAVYKGNGQWYHGLFIEMKRRKGGKLSNNQKEWILKLDEQGYKVTVAKGYNDAIKIITDYLNNSDTNN